jgi:hypothetical protein
VAQDVEWVGKVSVDGKWPLSFETTRSTLGYQGLYMLPRMRGPRGFVAS